MTIEQRITKLSILKRRNGTDYVFVYTSYPSAIMTDAGTLTMQFECTRGTAEEYCRKNFPHIPASVINGDAAL